MTAPRIQMSIGDNKIEVVLSASDFNNMIMSTQFAEEYKAHGLNEQIWSSCVNYFLQLAIQNVNKVNPRPSLNFASGVMSRMEQHGDMLRIFLEPYDEDADDDYTDIIANNNIDDYFDYGYDDDVSCRQVTMNLVNNTPQEDDAEFYNIMRDNPQYCVQCFLRDMLSNIVMALQMSPYAMSDDDIIDGVLNSHCCESFLSHFEDDVTRDGAIKWLTNRIIELCRKEPSKGVFYKTKNMDIAISAAIHVKYGYVLNHYGSYFIVSNRDSYVLSEYGTKTTSFVYPEESIICGVKDGKICNKNLLKSIFNRKPDFCADKALL